LLVEALFDSAVGGWAALCWAVDAQAAGINLMRAARRDVARPS
jgi:hypothetical protein